MSFRVEATTCGCETVIVCEGHLDAETATAIERAWAAAETAGLRPAIRICRGTTADRRVVARLARYDTGSLTVESPFLRAWLDELRAAHT